MVKRLCKKLWAMFHVHEFELELDYDFPAIIQLPLWGRRVIAVCLRCKCGHCISKTMPYDVHEIDWDGSRLALRAGKIDHFVLERIEEMKNGKEGPLGQTKTTEKK